MQFFHFGRFKIVAHFLFQDFLEDSLLVVIIVNREIAVVPLTAHGSHHGLFRKAQF